MGLVGCLDGIVKVSEGCSEGFWRVFGVSTGQARTGQVRSDEVRMIKSGWIKSRQVK